LQRIITSGQADLALGEAGAQPARQGYPQEVAMDALTLVILAIGALLLLRALFPAGGGADYVVVEIQRAPQRPGCVPILAALLAATLLLLLLGGGR
jgi:hypothetical protein